MSNHAREHDFIGRAYEIGVCDDPACHCIHFVTYLKEGGTASAAIHIDRVPELVALMIRFSALVTVEKQKVRK